MRDTRGALYRHPVSKGGYRACFSVRSDVTTQNVAGRSVAEDLSGILASPEHRCVCAGSSA
jgi:hypothetical protein